jgi:hypothetical protein
VVSPILPPSEEEKKERHGKVAANVEKRRASLRYLALPEDPWFSGEGLGWVLQAISY